MLYLEQVHSDSQKQLVQFIIEQYHSENKKLIFYKEL